MPFRAIHCASPDQQELILVAVVPVVPRVDGNSCGTPRKRYLLRPLYDL